MDDAQDLTTLVRELTSALEEAQAHIREQLQPEFENLADGVEITIPEGFTREQALMRLATWWHGVGTDELIARAKLAVAEPVDIEDPNVARVNEIVSMCYTPQGVRSWWDRPRHQLDGRTPREVIAEDPQRVLDLAEAGRSQG
jgi:hypothetical protein